MEHILFFILIIIIYKYQIVDDDVQNKLNARTQEAGLAQKRLASLREELPEYNSIKERKLTLREYLKNQQDPKNEKGCLTKEDFEIQLDYNKQVIKEISA